MKKIISVVGARPNFMKVAPLHRAFLKYSDKVQHLICHTGQHYDEKMSHSFFNALGMPWPDINLEVGSGSHAEQTGLAMIAYEKVLVKEQPDLVIVVGDVNSTVACALAATKLSSDDSTLHFRTLFSDLGRTLLRFGFVLIVKL